MLVRYSFSAGTKTDMVNIDEPRECPVCKHALKPRVIGQTAYRRSDNQLCYAVMYLCENCFRPFVSYSERTENFFDGFHVAKRISLDPNSFERKTFDEQVDTLSPSFVEIYNQALAAECHGLNQISGVGYRKAFEFLIKDFLISRTEDEEEKKSIRRMPLGSCISQKVSNDRLKTAASRCAWLGNDQTHYEQLFTEYDLQDLKKLIDVSVHWITMELLTDEALQIEPRGR